MLFYEVADDMLKIRGISLERLIYCLGVVVCAWLIQQGVFNNMAIYVPLLGWSFTEKVTVLIYYLLLFGNMLVFFLITPAILLKEPTVFLYIFSVILIGRCL